MDVRLLEAVRDLPKVGRYLHVPAQSGSDTVLERMKRGYTVAEYREMMGRISEIVPGCAVSSDFIVGFCGETDEDFEASLRLVEECRFKNSFIFKYSPRPGTKADDRLDDDVPESVKRERNARLLEAQTVICEEDNAGFIGQTVDVLVEGPSKMAQKQQKRQPAGSPSAATAAHRFPCVSFPPNPPPMRSTLTVTALWRMPSTAATINCTSLGCWVDEWTVTSSSSPGTAKAICPSR